MAADNHKNVLKSLEKAVQAVEDVQMPLSEDHYFYANFPEFKSQVNGFVGQVRSILSAFPGAPPTSEETFEETDEATDWVTGLLDDTLARVNFALADAKRTCEPATDTTAAERAPLVLNITEPGDGGAGQVKGALALPPSKGKGKGQAFVTYMNSTMREKPQEAFADRVDNSNIPFVHKLGNLEGIIDIEAAEEEALAAKIARRPRPHPLQSLLDSFTYPEWQVQLPTDPHMYKGFDATPFEFVNTVAALTRVAARLATARELAVDLEAHNYRSFQGFCCLMQLSTRSEDIIVDVMTLRAHVGKALGPIFANPAIVKVLHGSDGDIIWLQRDFGIYVCNLFDTGQAARVLSYPGHGLAYLLQRHCGFKADKRWQLADWRLRPLSEDALHYARADTHYLLYCYDVVRKELADLSQSKVLQHLVVNIPPGRPGGPLGLVLERSRQLCLHQYEKELLTETSFLTLYAKLPNQALSDEQLAAFAALYAWRDRVAREEDESLGYVLSRNQLLSLASEANMLVSPQDVLRRVGRGASPLVHRRAKELFTEIQASRSNAARAAKLWRQWREVHPDFLNRGLGSPVLVDFQAAAAAAAASLAPSIMPPQKTSSEDESLEEGERRDDDNDSVATKENPSGAQDMQMPRLQPKPLEKPLQLKPAGHSTAGSILAGNPPPTFASISMGSAAITKGNSFATLPVKSTAFGASGFSSIIARSAGSIPGSLADPGIPADVSKKLASIKAAMALPFTSAVNAPSSTIKDGGAEVENVDSGNDVVHKNQGTQAQVVREAVALMRRSDKEALENNEAAGREDANEPVLDTTRLLNAGSLQNEVEDFMPLSLTEQYGLKHGKRRLQRLHGNNRNKRDRSVDEDTTNAVNTRTAKEKKIKRTLQELGLEESEEEVAVGSAPQQPELQPTAGINITEAVQKYDVGIVNPHRNQQRGGFRGRRGPSRGRGGRAGRGRGSGGSHSNRGRGREEKAGPPTGRFNPYAGLDLSGVKVGKRSAVNVRSGNRSASFK